MLIESLCVECERFFPFIRIFPAEKAIFYIFQLT